MEGSRFKYYKVDQFYSVLNKTIVVWFLVCQFLTFLTLPQPLPVTTEKVVNPMWNLVSMSNCQLFDYIINLNFVHNLKC